MEKTELINAIRISIQDAYSITKVLEHLACVGEDCSKETKDMSRSFAEIGYALMGVKFDAKKQCTTAKGSGSPYICTADDYACVYHLCPGEIWSLACSAIN